MPWWEANIEIIHKNIEYEGVYNFVMAQGKDHLGAFVKTVMNLEAPWYARKFLTGWVWLSNFKDGALWSYMYWNILALWNANS
jgi:hypothetical protein